MKKFKAVFSSKKSESEPSKTPEPAKQGVAPEQPIIPSTPGDYGAFPLAFSVYFAGPSADKKSQLFYLGEQGKPYFQAFAIHKGMKKHQITLYSAPDFNSSPLALAGTEAMFRSTSILTLPPPLGGAEGVRVEKVQDKGGLTKEVFRIDALVGAAGEKQIESFEWRRDDMGRQPIVRELVKSVEPLPAPGAREVVAIWTDDATPEKEGILRTVVFQGRGASGELAKYWTLLAVMSLLRICQSHWEAAAAADKMVEAAGKVLAAGLSLAIM